MRIIKELGKGDRGSADSKEVTRLKVERFEGWETRKGCSIQHTGERVSARSARLNAGKHEEE